jgi:hypothetical protein
VFRFFCPPPCIYLGGGAGIEEGWATKKNYMKQQYKQFRQSRSRKPQPNGIAGTSSHRESDSPADEKIDEATELCAYIGIGSSEQEKQALDFSNGKVIFPVHFIHQLTGPVGKKLPFWLPYSESLKLSIFCFCGMF